MTLKELRNSELTLIWEAKKTKRNIYLLVLAIIVCSYSFVPGVFKPNWTSEYMLFSIFVVVIILSLFFSIVNEVNLLAEISETKQLASLVAQEKERTLENDSGTS